VTAGHRGITGDGAAVTVHVVLPGQVDDPASPSGGNLYDRRACEGLAAGGRGVRQVGVGRGWPRPGADGERALAAALSAIPSGAVVLIDGLVACGVPDVVVPQTRRLRLVVLVHLPLADETGLSREAAAELDARERATLRAAAAIVTTSDTAAGHLIEHHGLLPSRVHVAGPGVDPAPPAGGSASGSRLLCVAAVTPRKGHHVLVDVLTTLADLSWTCVVAGALRLVPDHVDGLRRMIMEGGLTDRISLVGPRTGDALARTYAEADLLILPSFAETYGMVVTEALARGVPVLASAVGGVPEALGHAPDGSLPGLLVPPGDADALAAALRRWLTEPELRDRLRSSASARRDTLRGWDETTRALEAVLDSVAPGMARRIR
jgi:glycosyltransferase involved in cell wall biosynthesis